MPADPSREIWITGRGVRSAAGHSPLELFEALGRGDTSATTVDPGRLPDRARDRLLIRIAALPPAPGLGPKGRRPSEFDRLADLSLGALTDAAAEAKIVASEEPDDRFAVLYGTGFGGVQAAVEFCEDWITDPSYRVPARSLLQCMHGTPAYHGARFLGASGTNRTISTACSSGLLALVNAIELLRSGRVDRVAVFAADSSFHHTGLEGWDRLGVFASKVETPTESYRPFDTNRCGFILGEGGAALILEAADVARARGAVPLARVLGGASNTSLTGITTPDRGAQTRVLYAALDDATTKPTDVGVVMAHASGTKRNDRVESEILAEVLGTGDSGPWILSSKPCVGHTMGVSGLLEAVVATEVIRTGRVPRLANYTDPDPRCPVRIPPPGGADVAQPAILINALAFGGNNAAAVLAPPAEEGGHLGSRHA